MTSLSRASGSMQESGTPILQAGRNCWKIAHANRFALLVDADAYFRAVRSAIAQARHSVFILAWDIDSRTKLVPGGANDGFPEPLGEFLEAVLAARPDLRIYILNWDFAVLYALERERKPVQKFGASHDRLQFHMDDRHPSSASHHQKVVVVDDALAFVGGLDLTRCRWDTPAHACDAPLRRDAEGKPYAPFHDVQALVDGDAAGALGELCRLRWTRATGHQPVGPCETKAADAWPAGLAPDISDVDVAIARTEPVYEDEEGVFEVRQLHLDLIAAARRYLFFENQYFTSSLIANALAERLREKDGPDVLVISPHTQSGWLEDATMGVLRARIHRSLKQADAYGRYGMVCPHLPGLAEGCLNVHSKVFAVDDRIFGVGSANLSARSMSLDTECHLAIEAPPEEEEGGRIRSAIVAMRNRLLAEHLDCEAAVINRQVAERGGLLQAVNALRTDQRSLRPLDPPLNDDLDALIPDSRLVDPEEPIDVDSVLSELLTQDARRRTPGRLAALGVFVAVLALLAIIWRVTPLRDVINLASMINLVRGLDALPYTPVAVIAGYAVAGLLMIPVTLLIAVTGIVFGPVLGGVYALTGAVLSAAVSYGIGMWLGRDAVRRMVGARINRLSKRISQQGIVAMMVIRFLPIAPFTLVNIVAGASHIRFRDFLIGTLLGMMPGIFVTVTFVHRLVEAIRHPSAATITGLLAAVALLITVAVGLQRLFERKEGGAAQ